MRSSLYKASLFLSILCLSAMLIGSVVAQTTDAYPGKPTPATGQETIVGAYPSVPTSVITTHATQPESITAISTPHAPAVAQQSVLLTYDIKTAPPTTVYYSGTFMPWTSFYQVFPANSPALWVATSTGWSWYATCPLGGWIKNLMYVPRTGTMKLYEFYPDGSVKLYSYGFATPGYKYIWFYADTPGRHQTLFTISDKPSNYITIDVI